MTIINPRPQLPHDATDKRVHPPMFQPGDMARLKTDTDGSGTLMIVASIDKGDVSCHWEGGYGAFAEEQLFRVIVSTWQIIQGQSVDRGGMVHDLYTRIELWPKGWVTCNCRKEVLRDGQHAEAPGAAIIPDQTPAEAPKTPPDPVNPWPIEPGDGT